jgi:hypothetical protein
MTFDKQLILMFGVLDQLCTIPITDGVLDKETILKTIELMVDQLYRDIHKA